MVHLRVNVARHSDVYQQQRTIAAQFHQRLKLRAIQNMMRRRCAADGDVYLLKLARPIVKLHRASAEFFSQSLRAFDGTVRNDDALGSSRKKSTRRLLARVTRADDHDFVTVE